MTWRTWRQPRRLAPFAVLLATVTSGCGQGGPSSLSPEPSHSPINAIVSVSPERSPSASQATVGAQWQPPPQPLPADPGLRDRLGPYAEFVLGDRGMVPPGSVEHLEYMATCIESAGFDVEIEAGGIGVRPGAQESSYRDAFAQCEAAAVDSGLVSAQEPPDDRALAAWYDAFMLTYNCMVEHGYLASAPPSKDSYVESDGRNWHPYDQLRGDQAAVERVCPQDLVILFEMLASGTEP